MYRLKQGRLHKVHIANLLLAANANGKKKKNKKKNSGTRQFNYAL